MCLLTAGSDWSMRYSNGCVEVLLVILAWKNPNSAFYYNFISVHKQYDLTGLGFTDN